MRLADVVLRRGHLSEDALVEVWSTGVRPAHLDQCDICTERAVDMSRWLEDVRTMGLEEADDVFSAERLKAQRGQVMARLEQLDRPAKVISFPARSSRLAEASGLRRISPGWLAAAAAAGLMLGVLSGELSHLFTDATGQTPTQVATATPSTTQVSPIDASALYDDPYGRSQLGSLSALDEMTPRLVDFVASNR